MKNSDSSPDDFFQKLNVEFLIHELKDPIAVIETGARTLLEKQDKFGALSPRQEKTMNRIIRNARKAREMLYSLLEVGRSEAGSFACTQFKPVETTVEVLTTCLEVRNHSVSDKIHQEQDMAQVLAYFWIHTASHYPLHRTCSGRTCIRIKSSIARLSEIL